MDFSAAVRGSLINVDSNSEKEYSRKAYSWRVKRMKYLGPLMLR